MTLLLLDGWRRRYLLNLLGNVFVRAALRFFNWLGFLGLLG